ncbi:cyclin-dependent kinase-like 2 [Protopterus annectens]|uniref:cyclin-dependent kinase-like 2 n=1 Tax=Protopterus annectens TaxID=7888 RepID=UPI001CFBD623|nr:cyclin-dependent kinase-like 2 [Protopterus annectens]
MEKYENLGLVGEGSYGIVMKCRHKENGRIVAIKKFLESEDDKMVKKIAMREIKLLKQLRHDNLVNLLEVCKKKKRWYLVFEFVDHTVLDDLEQFPGGLEYNRVRKYLYQILRGLGFCHSHNIIHRDIKPENILVSSTGVVKVCDFGFARILAAPGESYTDYVATRWYRAPELLVGDTKYGKAVDIWAVGCLVVEMLTGEPLFPGDSDIDQLYQIMKCFGSLTQRHQELFYKNPLFAGVKLPEIKEVEPLERRFPRLSFLVMDLIKKCLHIDPDRRLSCAELLLHDYFNKDGFAERFMQELNAKLQKDNKENPPFSKKSRIAKKDKEDNFGEDKKAACLKDTDVDHKSKHSKHDKILKSKGTKADLEKNEKVDKPTDMDNSDRYEKAIDHGAGYGKAAPQASLKDTNTSDRPKTPGITVIPPISSNPTSFINSKPGIGVTSGSQNYRVNEKMKKHVNFFRKLSQPTPSSLFNPTHITTVPSEKNILQTNKKKMEFGKVDVHFPELNNNHIPDLKGIDGKQFLQKY